MTVQRPAADSVAVVGLGLLGLAVARHLRGVVAGAVVGIDVDQGRRDAWRSYGADTASGDLTAAADVEHVFIVVSDQRTALSLSRELGTRSAGPGVYVLSTIDAETAAEFDQEPDAFPRCWPVQVTGGETRALRGGLVAIVPERLPAENERYLRRTVADRVVRAADARSAALLKLLGNALIAYEFAGLAAVLDAAADLGLDPRTLAEIALSGSSGSPALQAIHDYSPVGLQKDLALLGGLSLPAVAPHEAPQGIKRARALVRDAERDTQHSVNLEQGTTAEEST